MDRLFCVQPSNLSIISKRKTENGRRFVRWKKYETVASASLLKSYWTGRKVSSFFFVCVYAVRVRVELIRIKKKKTKWWCISLSLNIRTLFFFVLFLHSIIISFEIQTSDIEQFKCNKRPHLWTIYVVLYSYHTYNSSLNGNSWCFHVIVDMLLVLNGNVTIAGCTKLWPLLWSDWSCSRANSYLEVFVVGYSKYFKVLLQMLINHMQEFYTCVFCYHKVVCAPVD